MRSARSLAVLAVALVTLAGGGWLAPTVLAQGAEAVVLRGWWTRQPLAQPVADDGIAIGWSLEEEQSAAALMVDLSALPEGVVYLSLHEAGGVATDQGLARVCVTTDAFEAANPGPYEDLPASDCAAGETAELGRDESALTWLGDITALVAAAEGGTLSLVVHPVGKPLSDGVPATAPFEVQFDTATILVDPGPGAGPTPADDAVAGPLDGASGGGPSVDPVFTTPGFDAGYEAPALTPVPPPAGATTTTTAGPTPNELVALGPVDVTSGEARPWTRVLLLVPLSAGIGAAMAAARRWQLDRAISQGLA
jgi:hypothetical protein